MKSFWILMVFVVFIGCEQKQKGIEDPSFATASAFVLFSQSGIVEQNRPKDKVLGAELVTSLTGDFENNTPIGARCITNGTAGVCGTCNLAPSPGVNVTRNGSLVSTDDIDWYCFNMTAAGRVTISTERSDSFFQPKPTDTFIAIYASTVSTDFSCTTPFGCSSSNLSGGFDDDSNRTATDPYKGYSIIQDFNLTSTGVRYIRVGLTTDNPGQYRIRVVSRL